METIIRRTRSVCPICLRRLPAQLLREESGRILLEKNCPEHGDFRVPVWQGKVDWDSWLLGTPPLAADAGLHCPENCGLCPEHEIGSCCVLLEVTERCSLRCRFCFARGGEGAREPGLDELKDAIRDMEEMAEGKRRTAQDRSKEWLKGREGQPVQKQRKYEDKGGEGRKWKTGREPEGRNISTSRMSSVRFTMAPRGPSSSEAFRR